VNRCVLHSLIRFGGLGYDLHSKAVRPLMSNCRFRAKFTGVQSRVGTYVDCKLEEVCLVCIYHCIKGVRMVSIGPLNPRRKRASLTTLVTPNGCTCKRCNCHHPSEQYHSIKKDDLGYSQVLLRGLQRCLLDTSDVVDVLQSYAYYTTLDIPAK
jgi:hypothetical protein